MKSSNMTHLLLAAVFASSFGIAVAAEIEGGSTSVAAPMSSKLTPVTQAALDAAEGDKNSWLHSNMGYSNSRYH